MDYENIAIDNNMAGNQVIRFDIGDKRIHFRHERIKIKVIIQGVL